MTSEDFKEEMNKTRVISLESLNNYDGNYTFLSSKHLDNNFNTSLSDIFDTISLYESDFNDDSKSSRRLTWEEWYLKKKIEALKNENKLQSEMMKKMSANSKYAKLTEEEKQKNLLKWIEKKRSQKKVLEEKLKKAKEESEKKKEKKEDEKKKAQANYEKWLNELKKKEMSEKEKKLEEEKAIKLKMEKIKLKRQEAEKNLKENKKELIKVRPLSRRKGVAVVNGKICNFYDWSTSPSPSFINKEEWKN